MLDNGKRLMAEGRGMSSMNVKLTPHAAELLEAVRAQRQESAELILEHALEVFAHEQHVEPKKPAAGEAPRQPVSEMQDFVKRNRVHLGPGSSVKDLIHEGHRV
jgi:hypothetical protein